MEDVTMSKDELYSAVSQRVNLEEKEVKSIIDAFLEHFLVQFKLK